MKRLAIAVILLCACKGDSKPASQSFAEGMAMICGAADLEEARSANPADRNRVIAEWVDAKVTNPEARNVFEGIGMLALPEAERVLDAEARRAGLDGCALVRTLDPLGNVELPEVGDLPLEPVPEDAIVVIASANAVVIEGTEIVAVRDGAIDPAELENGRISKVRRFLEAMEADEVVLGVHPETRYETLFALAGSVRPPAPTLSLLARGERPGAIPLHIPDQAPPRDSMPAPAEEPLGMAVAIQAGEAIVFSMSGQEGTLTNPLVRVPIADAPARLRAVLGDLATRRWYGRDDRTAEDRRIVVMADGAVPASAVIPVVAAVRESFPDVLLGSGFE